MSTDRLWRSLAVLLPTLAAIIAPMSTVDLAYHLRAGAEMLASGAIPSIDTWTFTAQGFLWYDQQWGAQLILSLTERIGGWTGLVVLRAVLTGIIFGCLLLIALGRGMKARSATLLVLVAFVVVAPAMALRPQLLGMLCFALVLLLIERRRRHPRGIWLVPVIVAVWANLHGSFFLGPLALGLAWLADVHDRAPVARSVMLVTIVSIVSACLTPAGPSVWLYAVGLSVDPSVTGRITEWRPTSMRTPPGIAFFASVAAVTVLIARRVAAVPWPTLLWLGVFVAIGLYAERGIAWWVLAAVGPVAGMVAPASVPRLRHDPVPIRRANATLVALLVVAGVVMLPWWRPIDPGTRAPIGVLVDAPSGITATLRAMASGDDRILNHQAWGSWLGYAIPQSLIAIDSRIEFYPPEVWDRYDRVMAGVEGWQDQVQAWGITLVVLDAGAAATRDRFLAAGWHAVYEDGDGVIMTRPAQ